MDQATRNKLQKATQQIRRALESEFSEQLEGTFDILSSGKILPEPGVHLSPAQRLIRQKLVDSITHNQASGKSVSEAIQEYTREAAFTFLNRFVALRMLEARGILLECVSKGDQSSGFKEFTGLAAGLASLPDGGYRLYLECLCDELSVEVKVLFDRRDPAGLLWPRRNALNEILETLGQTDLTAVWKEDETIGWVYQYFNSSEERKQMRDESAAPRNSRELAVRNQFFTPRYVVEFLTDNTLGRIWYEMRQGQTRLKETCKYLVRRPSEVFLAQGETAPPEQEPQQELSQEELLKKTVYIPFRPKKDPRDLKVLDPASGSGHFLLYSFDLLLTIYEEAYDDDELGPALKRDYPTLAEFTHDIPRLILAHNLHGIDIDLRATQIASLALWMRAQRAFQEMKLPVASRPPIRRSNIVCAEPMPGEAHMLDEFANQLNPPVLGQLVRVVFDKMKLAGEAGSLLKIEEEIRDAVETARQQFGSGPVMVQTTFFDVNTPAPRQQRFDLSGVRETEFFEQAEALVLDALRIYAEQAQTSQKTKRRLFAQDAARGFAFIDLCRKRYDVALMNPPFGEATNASLKVFANYPKGTPSNLYSLFFVQAAKLTTDQGAFGAISDSTFLKQPTFTTTRQMLLSSEAPLYTLIDLGWDVLDANVRTAISVVMKSSNGFLYSLNISDYENKSEQLLKAISNRNLNIKKHSDLMSLPKSVFALNLSAKSGQELISMKSLGSLSSLPWGCGANDSFQLFRLRWEIDVKKIGSWWAFLTNGGSFSPFYRENFLVCRREMENGRSAFIMEFREGKDKLYDAAGQELYFLPGLTYPKRSDLFHASVLPKGHVFTPEGKGLFFNDVNSLWMQLGVINSTFVASIGGIVCGPHKQRGDVELIRIPEIKGASVEIIVEESKKIYELGRNLMLSEETSTWFVSLGNPSKPIKYVNSVIELIQEREVMILDSLNNANIYMKSIDFQVEVAVPKELSEFCNNRELEKQRSKLWNDLALDTSILISFAMGLLFGRWDIRYATGEKAAPELPDPFASLPVCPPGQLQNEQGLPAGPGDVPEGYPVPIPWDGILVDDPNHPDDIVARSRQVMELIWHDKAADIEHEAAEILGVRELRDYFRKSAAGGFWPDHIKRYSKSRRKAPIYWQLATASGTYSVWLYYHRFTSDTFFKILNEYARPKLAHERQKLDRLKGEFGAQPTRSQQKELETQESLIAELAEFTEEIQRVAPLWRPNLNDGVIINFAPLWRLVPQNKPWQKECKACWDSLVKGEYDWSHLAMHLWPERVVPKCQTDASLAIAHGLEAEFWQKDARDRYQPKPAPECGWEVVVKKLVAERQSPAVKASVESLIEAPVSQSGGKGGRKRKGTA